MPRDRDVAAFAERADGYEEGWRGRLHHEISDRTAELALAQVPAPHRVLDVGSGTGYLLRQLAARAPDAVELVGVDAAAPMVRVAQEVTADPRVRFQPGTAERLPGPDGAFDLVVSTTSFDHWADQEAGLRECARVTGPGRPPGPGRPVLAAVPAHPGRQPPGQGPHPAPGHPPAGPGRVPVAAMARPVRRHHRGGYGVEVTRPLLEPALRKHDVRGGHSCRQ